MQKIKKMPDNREVLCPFTIILQSKHTDLQFTDVKPFLNGMGQYVEDVKVIEKGDSVHALLIFGQSMRSFNQAYNMHRVFSKQQKGRTGWKSIQRLEKTGLYAWIARASDREYLGYDSNNWDSTGLSVAQFGEAIQGYDVLGDKEIVEKMEQALGCI